MKIFVRVLLAGALVTARLVGADQPPLPTYAKAGELVSVQYVVEAGGTRFFIFSRGNISIGGESLEGCPARVARYDLSGKLQSFYGANFGMVGVSAFVRPQSMQSWGPGSSDYVPDAFSWKWETSSPSAVTISDGYSEASLGSLRNPRTNEEAVFMQLSRGKVPPDNLVD